MTQAQNSVLLNNLNHAMSRISWTFFTQNFWIGCTRVGDACLNCYIGRGRGFGGKDPFGKDAPYLTKTWDNPAQWQAELAGRSQYVKVFTCSLSDFFHKDVNKRKLPRDPMYARIMERSGSPYWRDNAWQVIKDSPNCVFQILTKRPERIIDHLPKDWNGGWSNVWLGTSVGCESALPYIDHLRKVPIHLEAVRFISAEPLLEDISKDIDLAGIGWLICGGESGPGPEHFYDRKHRKAAGRRIMQLDWAYDLLQKCRQQRTPYFFKQITDSRAGQGSDALGRVFHEFPNPPTGGTWWVNKDPLAVLQSPNGGVWWTEREDEQSRTGSSSTPAEKKDAPARAAVVVGTGTKAAKDEAVAVTAGEGDPEPDRAIAEPAKAQTKLKKPVYKEGTDFDPALLTPIEADELLELMKSQPFADNRVSYGPQVFPSPRKSNAWKDRYALATNPQPEPAAIRSLRLRLSERYGVPFNSVQCNWHAGNSEVKAHYDPYRVIAMVRLGATRTFEVGDQRRNGGRNFKPYPMPHGSLITFLSGGLAHRMFPDPGAGDCVSLIFRLVTQPQTVASWHDKPTYSKTRAAHKKLYDAAVSEYRAALTFRNGGNLHPPTPGDGMDEIVNKDPLAVLQSA